MPGNLIPSNLPPEIVERHSETSLAREATVAMTVPVEEEGKVNWGRYIAALKRYKWMMLVIVILGVVGGVAAARFLPPEYTVNSTIWVGPTTGESGPIRPGELLSSLAWIELLRTYVVFDPVVQRMRLYVRPKQLADSAAFRDFDVAERFQTGLFKLKIDEVGTRWILERDGNVLARGVVGDSIGSSLGWHWAPKADQLGKEREISFALIPPREASNQLMGRLGASMAENGNFLRVSLVGTNRQELAPVLNAILQQFVDIAAELKKRKLVEMRTALDSQLTIAEGNLREAETKLQSFRVNTITQPSELGAPVAAGLAQTSPTVTNDYFARKVNLETLREQRQQIEDVLARAQAGGIAVDAFQTIPAVRQAPDLVRALTELSNLEADTRALRFRYTDEYKGIQQNLASINTIRTQTIPALAQALIDQLKVQEKDAEKRIDVVGGELRNVPTRTITEMRLTREMSAAEELFRNLQARHEEAKLKEMSAVPDLKTLDPATPPQAPSSNSAPRLLLMSIVGSIGLAVGLTLLLDQLDKRFRYPEQVSQELGLPILGAIPAIKRNRGGALDSEEAAQVVEAFRTVRLNLAHSYGAAGPIMLTVSSPGSGDGKSLVCSNLAVSFSEAGYQTLLIDGDTRRGELHRMFGVDRRPGLLDYLTGASQLEDVIRPTTHRGLWVVPCGTRRQQGPELLGSAAMARLMGEVKSRFNVIVVDSPPLGAGIDPFVLGTATGHMMLVFRSGETNREMAEAKLKMIDRLPVRMLGAVLNDIRAHGVYRYYSYLYGYSAEDDSTPQLAERVDQS